MHSRQIQILFMGMTLLLTGIRTAAAQPGPSPNSTERKQQLLNAELFIAISDHNPAQVNAILARGADPNRRNWLGFVPLMWAADNGVLPIVDALLAHHAQLEAKSMYGTALSFALIGRREATALHLLDRGASIHTDRADGATALMIAGANGEAAVVKRLLAKQDDPNAKDVDGATPLIYAARNGRTEIVKALLRAGAHPNAQDGHGRTALMYAAENGQAAALDLLLANQAAVDVKDNGGTTALLLASRYSGAPSVVRSLLKAGADPIWKDDGGADALASAEARGHSEAAQALHRSGDAASETSRATLYERSRRQAVMCSLAAIQGSIKTFASRMQCASCHHQGLGLMALGTAQQHGFTIDRELVGETLEKMGEEGRQAAPMVHLALYDPNVAKTIRAVDIRELSIGAGYLFGGLIANGVPANPGLHDMAQLLTTQQSAEGCWGYGQERGPMQSSYVTTTALALQILQAYGAPETSKPVADSIQRAKRWLLTTATPNMEDRSSRLIGLKRAGASKEERAKSLQAVLAAQRPDGGWAQRPFLASDAYATGMALYALQVGGELTADDPAVRRGVQFLLRTQDEDGTWYVNKLANPANIFMDAGFPHGESQYISFAATCWAVMALVQSQKGVE